MADHHYHRKKKSDPIEVRIVLGFLRGVYWLVTLPFAFLKSKPGQTQTRQAQALDTTDILKRWSDIEMTVGLGGASHFGTAVVNADKLVDYVLRSKGYTGDTMGERMKSVKGDLSNRVYEGLWQAHKLRNTLVHEVEGEVMSFQAKNALGQFKDVLIELGALK